MRVFNTSSLNDRYTVYVQEFNKLATRVGRTDETPMSIDKFAKSYGVMYQETRPQKMSAMAVIKKMTKADLQTSSWKQAVKVNREQAKKAGFTYDQIRYGRKFWEYLSTIYYDVGAQKVSQTYFDSEQNE